MRKSLIFLFLVLGCASGFHTMGGPANDACSGGKGHNDGDGGYDYALVCVNFDMNNRVLVANPHQVRVKTGHDIYVMLTQAGELDVQFTRDTPMQLLDHTPGSADAKRRFKAHAMADTGKQYKKYAVIDRVTTWWEDPDVMIDP